MPRHGLQPQTAPFGGSFITPADQGTCDPVDISEIMITHNLKLLMMFMLRMSCMQTTTKYVTRDKPSLTEINLRA